MLGVLLFFLFTVFHPPVFGVRVRGQWTPGDTPTLVIAKFGFQQTSSLQPSQSLGYIFGNITSDEHVDNSSSLAFVIVNQPFLGSFESRSIYGTSCAYMLQNVSRIGYEKRCFNKNKFDLLRVIPCPKGELCEDEDDPKAVLPGYQLTLRIQENNEAEYWYLILLACRLDDKCVWQRSDTRIAVHYDIFLTNGHPQQSFSGLFESQFSFDEQDSAQLYLIGLLLWGGLWVAVWRAKRLIRKKRSPPERLQLLGIVVVLKVVGVALQCINVFAFAFDGEGIALFRLLGELFRLLGVQTLCLLLILLARGWNMSPRCEHAASKPVVGLWALLSFIHIILFFCNTVFLYDVLHDVDVFTSWPGYGMLMIRILFALWFLVEIRRLIQEESWDEKAEFLAHLGAGFLVWFVYLPGLGVVASFISVLWRFKIILGITTFANFMAVVCLTHLFWPSSTNRKFFQADADGHRRIGRTTSAELEDFEKMLLEGDGQSDEDNALEADDAIRSLQSI